MNEYHLFKTAERIVNTPSEKIPINGIFFFHGSFIRRNIGRPIASITTSEDKLKTAFVMRWFVAASHCLFGVGTA